VTRSVDRRGVNSLDRHGVMYRFDGNAMELPADPSIFVSSFPNAIRSITMYSMYEALARERMREQREQSARRRLSQDVASVRRWHRLADFSARRATRSRRQLAEHSAADFQLVA
jgi:hypothetical protein